MRFVLQYYEGISDGILFIAYSYRVSERFCIVLGMFQPNQEKILVDDPRNRSNEEALTASTT